MRAAGILQAHVTAAQAGAIAESEEWAMALVAAGVGIAIVPEGVARGNPDVAMRAIDIAVTRQVGLAYPSAHPPSDALKAFIASLPRQANSRRVKSTAKKTKRA
nr:LysR family transcriptional regulator substrate-binding protein [Bradyrhizobium brasilense]